MRGRTIADELVSNYLVVVHAGADPLPSEWREHCAGVVARREMIRGALVLAASEHGPTPVQRRELTDAWGRSPPPIALLSASIATRGVLTALNWVLGNAIRAFDPRDVAAALEYLKVPLEHRDSLRGTLDRLAAELT